MRRGLAVASAVAAAAGAAASGCGSITAVAAPTLLRDARRVVDHTSAAHFVIDGRNLPSTGDILEGGSGDLRRPGELRGTFQVAVDGLPASVKVVEAGGKFYAELPFTRRYMVTDPSKFGFSDPAQLLDPQHGVSRLLTQLQGPAETGERRLAGEVLEDVAGRVPGTSVTGFLPDVAPAKPVRLVFGIDPSSHQVRQVSATGPFASAATASTYIVTLTHYGEAVRIASPA